MPRTHVRKHSGRSSAFVTFLLLPGQGPALYAAELNPVLDRALYPRALPLGDPTEADKQVRTRDPRPRAAETAGRARRGRHRPASRAGKPCADVRDGDPPERPVARRRHARGPGVKSPASRGVSGPCPDAVTGSSSAKCHCLGTLVRSEPLPAERPPAARSVRRHCRGHIARTATERALAPAARFRYPRGPRTCATRRVFGRATASISRSDRRLAPAR